MRKILVVGMSPIVGGVNTYILNIFMHLCNKYHFEFINTYNKPLVGLKLIRLNGGVIRYLNTPQNSLKYFVRYKIAKKFFKEHHDYDIIDVNTSTINKIFWIKAASKYGINNCIIHSHIDSSNKPKWFKLLSKYLVIYNQHYLLNHPKITKLAASKKCGAWMFGKHNDFKVISNGVNTQQFCYNSIYRKNVREKLSISNNNKVIITTSRLEPVKNYSKIINVFFYIHKIIPNSSLIILGTGSEFNKIKDMVYSYHLSNNVYFLGNKKMNEIPKYLSSADMMIMPSIYEGLPFSLIEAQSCGLPALVSKGIPEAANVTGNVHYLSVNSSDKEWAKKSIKLLYSNNSRMDMNDIVKGSKFNLNKTVNEIDGLYSHMINHAFG